MAAPERLNPWLAEMLRLRQGKADVVPTGWHTREEVQLKMGIGRTGCVCALREMIEAGSAEVRQFRIPNKSGDIKPIPHYRLKALASA